MQPRPIRTALRTLAVCVLALVTRPAALAAQHEGQAGHESHEGHDMSAGRYGVVSFVNSGTSAAQPAFLRGLALLHDFQYAEAAAAFREAQRIAPGFAMSYWGEAMTYNHGVWREQDSLTARAVLARLGATPEARLAKAPTPREQDYLRTLDVLYGTAGTKASRDTAYAAAMAQLARRYPDDPDAQLFHALALLSLFPRTDSTYLRAGAIAERVLRDHPRHPGALHYVIHAYDDPAHAARGLAAARAYALVAPDAPHAQHMTSHIFIAVGLWDDVVAANEASNPDARKFGVGAPPACGHGALWLQYAYLQQGRLADARRMLEACHAGIAAAPDVAPGFAEMRLRYLVEVDQPPREIVALDAGRLSARGAEAKQLFGTAYDALRRGDTATALPLIEDLRALRAAFEASPRASVVPEVGGQMQVMADELHALVLLERGSADDAVAQLRSATAREDALPFAFGPPAVEKPSHELLAEVLLDLKRPAEARPELERQLARTPGRSRTLRDLARASRALGDTAAAADAERKLAANRARADAPSDAPLGTTPSGTTPSGTRVSRDMVMRSALSEDALIAVSVRPLPERLRAGAAVVTLDAAGQPVPLRAGTNGMVCVRMTPGEMPWDARCYHASFTPLFFRAGQLRRQGLAPADVARRMDEEIRSGTLHLPAHPTAGYRMLGSADAYDPTTGAATTALRVWESVHMPYRTAAELGFPDETEIPAAQRGGVPYVMASGTWWAHVMIRHDAPSSPAH